jgi:hypothetical protein
MDFGNDGEAFFKTIAVEHGGRIMPVQKVRQ